MTEQTIPIATTASRPDGSDGADQASLIASHAMPLPATFSFETYGVKFDAAVCKSEGDGATLVVSCDLGHVPFSAESATLRRYLHAVIDAGTGLPMAEITLDRRQTIVLHGTMDFPEPPSPAATAAGTAAIAISVKPVVEIIETCRIGSGAKPLTARSKRIN